MSVKAAKRGPSCSPRGRNGQDRDGECRDALQGPPWQPGPPVVQGMLMPPTAREAECMEELRYKRHIFGRDYKPPGHRPTHDTSIARFRHPPGDHRHE